MTIKQAFDLLDEMRARVANRDAANAPSLRNQALTISQEIEYMHEALVSASRSLRNEAALGVLEHSFSDFKIIYKLGGGQGIQ